MDLSTNGHGAMVVSESDLKMSHDKIQLWMASLKGEMLDMMNRDILANQRLTQLEPQLEDMSHRYNHLQKQYNELLHAFRELNTTRDKVEGHRAVVLIDGDGALFNFDLIEQGQFGGGKAAARIMESIKEYMGTGRRDEIWVYVFLNKKGLKVLLQRQGRVLAMNQLDDFIIGMNEASKTIMVVDVGQKKEAADSKVKVLLESEVRSPETRKIFFAGSHDNGYVTDLRAQVTAGFKEKLVLVPSYTEIAAGYRDLGLAKLIIPGLFMPEKLPFMSPNMRPAMAQPTFPAPYERAEANFPPAPPSEGTLLMSPILEPSGTTLPPGKKNAKRRGPKTELPGAKVASSSDAGGQASDTESLVSSAGGRQLNPKFPLIKQKPPPCTMFYVIGACKFGLNCKYAHNYNLTAEHVMELREKARKIPCQARNNGEECAWGANCCYGHKCNFGPGCRYHKAGNCKFVHADMH